MKKTIIVLAALALVGCAKEAIRVETVEAPALPTTRVVTITAGFETTKTAYDEDGKFSWEAGDQIGVLVSNGEETKQVAFVADEAGPVSTFTGIVEEGYELSGNASYPFTGVNDGYGRNDLAWDAEKGGWRIWGSIKPSLENPLASTPLWGTLIEGTQSFTFTTACAIVKFTVKNVPMETAYAYLQVPEESDANLNGWFNMTDGVIRMDDAVEPWQDRYNWNVPTELNSTMEYYYFLPVGTLPEGTKFELCDSNWSPIHTATFAKDVEIVRNAVTNIAAIELEPTPTYTLEDILGTYDMEVTEGWASTNHETGLLVIEESDDAEKGNIMITMFAGVPGKQYGNFDGVNKLVFSSEQLFGANPYASAADHPYVALDFYTDTVVDPEFLVLAQGKIKGLADIMGFRACTEEEWFNEEEPHGGAWPWELCYGSLIATWHEEPVDPGSSGEDLNDPVEVDPWTE